MNVRAGAQITAWYECCLLSRFVLSFSVPLKFIFVGISFTTCLAQCWYSISCFVLVFCRYIVVVVVSVILSVLLLCGCARCSETVGYCLCLCLVLLSRTSAFNQLGPSVRQYSSPLMLSPQVFGSTEVGFNRHPI